MYRSAIMLATVAAAGTALAAPPDTKAIAEKVVGEVAGVKEGEHVWISGDIADVDLVENITIAAQKRGGLTQSSLGRSGMVRRYYAEVPARFDAQQGVLAEKLVALEDVVFFVWRMEDFTETEGVDPARVARVADSGKNIGPLRLKDKVRIVELGNGLYPTKANAKRLGVSERDLEKMFWGGLNTDYALLAARGAAVQAAVPAGKTLTIKNKAGTDLSLKLKPLSISDGIISADDVKTGGAALSTWLPAGEAYGLVEPGSAAGTLVTDLFVHGRVVKGVKFTVKGGKVADITAGQITKDFDKWKENWNAMAPCKENVSIVDFGLNGDVKAPKSKTVATFVPEGVVTIVLGDDSWAAGTNTCGGGATAYLTDATVAVDGGSTVVDAGVLKVGKVDK